MKATGLEIKAFWDAWPPGKDWYYDDGPDIVNDEGTFVLDLDKKYNLLDFGFIAWQGEGKPPLDSPAAGMRDVSFQHWYSAWKRKRTEEFFSIVVPKDQVESFRALCAERNWRIL